MSHVISYLERNCTSLRTFDKEISIFRYVSGNFGVLQFRSGQTCEAAFSHLCESSDMTSCLDLVLVQPIQSSTLQTCTGGGGWAAAQQKALSAARVLPCPMGWSSPLPQMSLWWGWHSSSVVISGKEQWYWATSTAFQEWLLDPS